MQMAAVILAASLLTNETLLSPGNHVKMPA